MKAQHRRSAWRRALNALCTVAVLSSTAFMLVYGVHGVAAALVLLSLASIATPVVLEGEGLLEILTGIVEAIADGVIAIIDAIVSAIAGLFG